MPPMVLSNPLIPGIQICCSAEAGNGHFCRPLMVAHEFRLCLHPRGMLRVQSLHLPIKGLARRNLLCCLFFILPFTQGVSKPQFNRKEMKPWKFASSERRRA